MEELLLHYEHELGLLNRRLAEFSRLYPKVAARFGLAGDNTDDPHVERLVQAFAFEAAHIDAKLADDYPEFTEALLDMLYPGYLRTVPSCAIARFEPEPLLGQLTEPFMVPRGSSLDARAAPCRFQTVYDVTLSPLRIHAAQYTPTTLAPTIALLPTDATGIVSLTFATASPSCRFDAAIPSSPLRVYLSGERALVAPLADTLLLRACAAFVEADQTGRWHSVSKVPIDAVGFADHERLLPGEPGNTSHHFGHLLEYFAFPEKFDFIDIDLGRIRRAAREPAARLLTLHIAVRDTPAASSAAQVLATLDATTFKLFCTPVVNLFKRSAMPIALTASNDAYPVIPVPLEAGSELDVYSIDGVYLGDRATTEARATYASHRMPRTAVPPHHALSHSQAPEPSGAWWIAFRDPDGALQRSGGAVLLSLVDLKGQPTRPQLPRLDVDTTATNRDLPSQLPIGAPEGDLLDEGTALSCPIMLLTQPTRSAMLPRGQGALWRLLSMMSPHPFDLTQSGLSALKGFLRLHASRSAMVALHCIDAIRKLDYQPAMRWMLLDNSPPSFVRGVEIHLSFDEMALREVSLYVTARMFDRLFAPYAPMNSYVQLVVCSHQTGEELIRCETRPGTRMLI